MVKLTLQQKLQRYSKLYKCLEVCGNKLVLQEMSNNLILKTLIVSQKSKFFILFNIFFENYGKIYVVILVKNLILLYERILRFIIFDNTVYKSLFNYLVTVMAIFVTIYNYRAHNYFITIVMKFRNYFPSSNDKIIIIISNKYFRKAEKI